MNNVNWTQNELSDVHLLYPDWAQNHIDPVTGKPTRTYTAHKQKRAAYLAGHGEVVKARPVDDDPETADPELRRIAAIETDAKFVAAYEEYHRAYQKAFPPGRDIQVGVEQSGWIAVALMADWHIGSEGTDIDRLKADINLIATHPRLYCGLGGDVIDNFILAKMASAAQSSDATVKAQWRLFAHYLMPLIESGSLLWTGSGNHDAWSITASQIDPLLWKLREVAVSITREDRTGYLGEGGYIDLRIGPKKGPHQTYVFWRKHKPTRFRSSFNPTHWHMQMLRGFLPREWEVGIGEHFHNMSITNFWYRESERFAVNVGSYKVRDDWATSGGFYDGGYGVPTCVLNSERHEFHVFSSIRKALQFIDGPVVRMKVVD